MIDILLADEMSYDRVGLFLSKVFDCPVERIKIFSLDEFNALSEQIDESSFHCICVISSVRGSVAQLLQLFKCKINEPDGVNRIVNVALEDGIECYLPINSLNDWIFLSNSGVIKHAEQMETDGDDCYLFHLI